jgi:hypothetical protein
MTDEERERKHELLYKISNLVKLASALGKATDDEQTRFIAESCMLVLMAGSDPEDTLLLSDHIINYLESQAMRKGEKTAKGYLTKDYKVQLN